VSEPARQPAAPVAGPKYWAFISYSHRDKEWGDWLHRGLEAYKTPKPLAGRVTRRGEPVPARLFPIFRDREELPTSADLGSVIAEALDQSRYLIVICSPSAAQSRWVNKEIVDFKKLGRADRILALIVDGEPNAAAAQECFPDALKYELGPDGQLDPGRPTEPIAADARATGDGKANAKLKLLAGLLGVNYDDLKRRDEERRRQRQRRVVFVSVCLMLVFAGLAGAAVWEWQDAVRQKKDADAQRQEAVRQKGEAEAQRQAAEEQKKEADVQRQEALRQKKDAVAERQEAEEQRKEADAQRRVAVEQKEVANTQRQAAEEQRKEADLQRQDAERQKHEVQAAFSKADFSAALEKLGKSDDTAAIAYLCHALRTLPENHDASALLASILSSQQWYIATPERLVRPKDKEERFLRLSADWREVATLSTDHAVRIWDPVSGGPIGAPMSIGGVALSARFSPDGSRLLVTAGDNTTRVWDVATGKPVSAPMRHNGELRSAVFSPDGRRVVTACMDKTARVWDAVTGLPVAPPMRHGDGVFFAAFSPDGERVVTASLDHTARVWDVETGSPVSPPIRHDHIVV